MTHSRHSRRVSCQCNKRVPKLDGRCIRFALTKRRFVCRLPALVVESNLVRSFCAFPTQLQWRLFAVVVEPRCLCGSMPIGALPHFTYPSAIDAPLPPDASRRGQPMRRPCAGFRRVFQHSAEPTHRSKRAGKASAIISGPVVFATPALVIDRRKRAPQLARRMRNNRPRATVFPRVALFRPRINFRIPRITSIWLHENCGNVSHNKSFNRKPLRGSG